MNNRADALAVACQRLESVTEAQPQFAAEIAAQAQAWIGIAAVKELSQLTRRLQMLDVHVVDIAERLDTLIKLLSDPKGKPPIRVSVWPEG